MRKVTEDFIGTCQACFGEFKVNENSKRIVFHGYQRPGHGYTIGQCQGTDHAPFEYDTALTVVIIAEHRAIAMKQSAYLARLNDGKVDKISRMERQYNERHHFTGEALIEYTPKHKDWGFIVRWQRANTEGAITYHNRVADYLQKMVNAWKPGQIVGIDVPATGKERALRKAYDPAEADAAEARAAEKAKRDAKPGKLKVVFYQREVARTFEAGDETGWRKWLDAKHAQETKFLADIKAVVKSKFAGKTRVAAGYSSDLPRAVERGDYDVVVANLPWEYRIEMEALLPGVASYETEAKRRSYLFYGVPA